MRDVLKKEANFDIFRGNSGAKTDFFETELKTWQVRCDYLLFILSRQINQPHANDVFLPAKLSFLKTSAEDKLLLKRYASGRPDHDKF
ncbi:hypothetical protein [Secundilactobacillus collinoides]|uniref:Uncharacterized protein n=1 Tax=Secundilactobacillus collinoides TaxID=33960 RepID=A0A166G852_SECCO|nr:hypothetical protein [Secundilactobacillus collinoides]KZL37159.1 hypothetical protein TY91_13075 [Secundilactobacillus collinoides]